MTSCAHARLPHIFIDRGRHIVTTAIGFANPVFGYQAPSQLLGHADELIEERVDVRSMALERGIRITAINGCFRRAKRTSFGHAPMSANDQADNRMGGNNLPQRSDYMFPERIQL